ncbi:hypothetical protein [Spiroplasma floricola]|uniref:Uncharacterized protein n=1 Tax=Spiroplasma floricola 23-6 TaxID=1336749 RepID=A0A2K8SFQ6_9MOLU|nr:hypothetical protein [Spiroplasma floricola]AUB31660.1 hypothetical protein SFLOR_v1c06100 [Spiroplasma floricola 23-6]
MKRRIRRNLILPSEFLNNWKTQNEDGSSCFKYIDFVSDQVEEIEVENVPFIELLFSQYQNFDTKKIIKQFNQISKVAKAIVDKRIKKNDEFVEMTGKEVLFLKYFYFLITLINGEYKYSFGDLNKKYRIFDVLNFEIEQYYRLVILNVVSYVLFEMYDYIFSKRTFESLYEYVETSSINFNLQEYQKTIIIPSDILTNQNYKFLDVYFHNVVNNTFFKFFKISELDEDTFLLTNKTIANFIDDRTKINILSLFIVDPKIALGLVNLGPGRGEYRPLFKYFNESMINKEVLPFCLKPDHKIEEDGIYLSGEQRFKFSTFELIQNQVKLINDCLTYRDLKSDFEQFIKY